MTQSSSTRWDVADDIQRRVQELTVAAEEHRRLAAAQQQDAEFNLKEATRRDDVRKQYEDILAHLVQPS